MRTTFEQDDLKARKIFLGVFYFCAFVMASVTFYALYVSLGEVPADRQGGNRRGVGRHGVSVQRSGQAHHLFDDSICGWMVLRGQVGWRKGKRYSPMAQIHHTVDGTLYLQSWLSMNLSTTLSYGTH